MSVDWFPTVNEEKCTGCNVCLDFCINNVYEFRTAEPGGKKGKVYVVNPEGCIRRCVACMKLCPTKAITFPDPKTLGQRTGKISDKKEAYMENVDKEKAKAIQEQT